MKRWTPGTAALFFGMFRVSAELCRVATQTPPWVLVSGLIAAPPVLLTWYWRDTKRRDDHRLALESGIAARYKEAAQLLAADDPMTRINGLFSLWDIARESAGHRITVSRTLAAFVRVRASRAKPNEESPGEEHAPAPDVQEAVRLIAASEWANESWFMSNGRKVPIDFRSVALPSFDLRWSRLEHADLRNADLSGANLNGAYLVAARLTRARMNGAKLRGTRLTGADLRAVDLEAAEIVDAVFTGARYDARTRFPSDFGDPEARGMELETPASREQRRSQKLGETRSA